MCIPDSFLAMAFQEIRAESIDEHGTTDRIEPHFPYSYQSFFLMQHGALRDGVCARSTGSLNNCLRKWWLKLIPAFEAPGHHQCRSSCCWEPNLRTINQGTIYKVDTDSRRYGSLFAQLLVKARWIGLRLRWGMKQPEDAKDAPPNSKILIQNVRLPLTIQLEYNSKHLTARLLGSEITAPISLAKYPRFFVRFGCKPALAPVIATLL